MRRLRAARRLRFAVQDAAIRPLAAAPGCAVGRAVGRAAEEPFSRLAGRGGEGLRSQGSASGAVRIDEVARELGCSRQTLYRRLKMEGVTFAELLDDLRRRLALRFVRERGLSVKEAAWRLGFSDPAAFSRAYKRWTGTSPSEARGKDRN